MGFQPARGFSPARFSLRHAEARLPKGVCYHEVLRIGIHTSRSGSLVKAAEKAAELGANTFQIFSASPRMWRASPPGPLEARDFRQARERHGLNPFAVHANYLINLAAADAGLRAKSVQAFRGELERSAALGADYVVVHPGSYRGMTPDEGVNAAAASLVQSAEGLRAGKMMVLLEHTAGAGASLGSRFKELRAIRAAAKKAAAIKIGFCLDTCHLYAAGWDIAAKKGFDAMVEDAGRTLGWQHVRVIHANDSKGALGSHLDRHANIGEGRIGERGFRRILSHPTLKDKPFILETPVENDGDDARNLETLRRLCPRSRTTTSRSN